MQHCIKKRTFTQIPASRAHALNMSETSDPPIYQDRTFGQPEACHLEATREYQSALCLIVISSLTPSPPTPTPTSCVFHCISQHCSHVLAQYSPKCAKSTRNPQIWCYTFAITIEMSLTLDFFFFLILINKVQQN